MRITKTELAKYLQTPSRDYKKVLRNLYYMKNNHPKTFNLLWDGWLQYLNTSRSK